MTDTPMYNVASALLCRSLAIVWSLPLPGYVIWPYLIIVQMVPVHCISRSHRLKIDFQDGIFNNLLV